MLNYEIRDNKLHISGYVNAVERDSKVIMTRDGRCVEQIAAGAFSKSLADGHEVRMKLNHKRDIGSTADGTLELREDRIGLYAEAETEDEELRQLAADGKLTGWSFGFVKRDGVMEQRGKDVPRRRINALDLSEVSILSVTPAYDGTSVECRAEEIETRSYDDYESAENGAQADDPEIRGRVQYFLMKEKIKQLKGQQRVMEVRYLVEEAKRKQAEYEERYNHYHDPHNGQFASGGGGAGGNGLYYSQGKGKGFIVGSSSPWQPKDKTANYGAAGTGFEVNDKLNGRKKQYKITDSGIIIGLGSNSEISNIYNEAVKNGKITTKELVKKVVANGGRYISKSEVKEISEKHRTERENRPSYEIELGTPWGNKNNRKAARIQHITDRIQRRPRGFT